MTQHKPDKILFALGLNKARTVLFMELTHPTTSTN